MNDMTPFDFNRITLDDPDRPAASSRAAAKARLQRAEAALETEKLLYTYEPTPGGQAAVDAAVRECEDAKSALEALRDEDLLEGVA